MFDCSIEAGPALISIWTALCLHIPYFREVCSRGWDAESGRPMLPEARANACIGQSPPAASGNKIGPRERDMKASVRLFFVPYSRGTSLDSLGHTRLGLQPRKPHSAVIIRILFATGNLFHLQ